MPMPVAAFARRFFDASLRLSRIGGGNLGGKAQGLLLARDVLEQREAELSAFGLDVEIPSLVIVGTEVFEAFLAQNDLVEVVAEERPDDRIAHAFRRASLPPLWLGDLRSLAQEVRAPLAVRSSSALEDALGQPFAGVYGTKMIPGRESEADARFRSLTDAIKFVYATTYFHEARAYMRATKGRPADERMAVILQEVVGRRHGDRFYPDLCGVARSYNFYPVGNAQPEEGVVHLALGLGKQIVDGGVSWSFSPAHPRAVPPFASVQALVKATQTSFWAVHMGPAPAYDPMAEDEYLVRAGLGEAEADGALSRLASTYDPRSERLVPGTGRPGPRVLDFAPLLHHDDLHLVATLRFLLEACAAAAQAPVEIEFAATFPPRERPRLAVLQVRPLLLSRQLVEVPEAALAGPDVVLASRSALGNGRHALEDVVFVDRAGFETRDTPRLALEVETLNRALLEAGRPYLLIGFGRWGSSDPWLGIPVRWDQISGAQVIVEACLPQLSPEPSQGSHFFHNLASFEVFYFSLPPGGGGLDWEFLETLPEVARTPGVRHVRCPGGLLVEVDGRTRRGRVARREETR
jgi:hypothetical protein